MYYRHRLARDLGRTVAELFDPETGISAVEFIDWLAFHGAEAHFHKHSAEKARKNVR